MHCCHVLSVLMCLGVCGAKFWLVETGGINSTNKGYLVDTENTDRGLKRSDARLKSIDTGLKNTNKGLQNKDRGMKNTDRWLKKSDRGMKKTDRGWMPYTDRGVRTPVTRYR